MPQIGVILRVGGGPASRVSRIYDTNLQLKKSNQYTEITVFTHIAIAVDKVTVTSSFSTNQVSSFCTITFTLV